MQNDEEVFDGVADANAVQSVIDHRSLAAVLFPAATPEPTNVRVLRRFGIDDQRKIRRLERSMRFNAQRPDPRRRKP
jgi:hypothetical protein